MTPVKGTPRTSASPEGTEDLKETQKAKEEELKNIFEKASQVSIDEIAPQEKKDILPRSSAFEIIESLALVVKCETTTATMAVCLLFAKGAANKGAPSSLKVILYEGTNKFEISKDDLLFVFKKHQKNPFLRRLAETLAGDISTLLQKHGLEGDLSKTINRRLIDKGQTPLNKEEKAWASSFCQGNAQVEEISQRLPGLLAEDFNLRFKDQPQRRNPKNPPKKKLQKKTVKNTKSSTKATKSPNRGKTK
jgi:hypothetical protein